MFSNIKTKSKMVKKIYSLFVIVLLWTAAVFAQSNSEFKPVFKKSKKTTHKIPKGQKYTFGYLEVLENRNNPKSKTIKIPVYIFKSRSKNPKPDPIIYTVGGPGSTTMPSAQYMAYYKYLEDRDFILIEQRGNFYAKPHLDCPEWSKAIYQSNLPNFNEDQYESVLSEATKSCRDRLLKKGIDLNGYNTNEIAADVNDLVNVLDIQEYNLLTISYSTKIAQVLLRDYPKGIRSVVMDSPLPLEVSYDEESAGNLLQKLETLLADCENDEACNKAYPKIKERFFEYLRNKTTDPLVVNVINPENKKEETIYLTGQNLIRVFTGASTSDVVNVPFEINKLLNNDLSAVKEQLSYLFNKPGDGAGMGMRLSVWCAEENPFNAIEVVEKETYSYPEISGLSPTTFDPYICDIWAVEEKPIIENQSINSSVPVLFINGEYDEITPSKWAIGMSSNLENSFHLIFTGWKHTPTTNWNNQCAMQAANDFFNNPNVKPNPACLEEIEKPVFKIE